MANIWPYRADIVNIVLTNPN